MSKSSLVGLVMFFFLVGFSCCTLSYAANYKLVCDDLDQTGGKASSPNFNLKVSAGGQASPIGTGTSANYKLMAGYVGATFVVRGNVNGDAVIDVGDVVYLINYLYKNGFPPLPMEAGDANCDGIVNVGDVVYLINYLYKGGVPPSC